VDDQRAAADGLGDVPEQLAVRVHRPDHIATAVRAEQDFGLRRSLGHRPHRGHAAGVDLEVVHAAWFGGDVTPVVEQAAQIVDAGGRVFGHFGDPAAIQLFQCKGFLARHEFSLQLMRCSAGHEARHTFCYFVLNKC